MGLNETVEVMESLMTAMCRDLVKASKGNKTAAQRVRTASIKFTKIAKHYREQSLGKKPKKAKKRRS